MCTRVSGKPVRLVVNIEQRDLIIVDELGYIPLGRLGAENLFGFFSKCYERTSVIVTSNLPFSAWPASEMNDSPEPCWIG